MMHSLSTLLVLLWTNQAWAAEAREPAGPSERARAFGSGVLEADAPGESAELERTSRSATASETQLDRYAVFELDRGFYVASDLGVFISVGGENGRSNAQPFLALHAGYDLNDFLSAQLSMTGAYVADNPPSNNELIPLSQGVESYQLLNIGAELVGSFRPIERLAIEPRLGGGIAFVSPALTDPGDPEAVLSSMNAQLSYGVDLTYLTLLTGFSAGLTITGTYVLTADVSGLGLGLHVRYTL